MILKSLQVKYTNHPWLSEPVIDKAIILDADLTDFDYTGYRLSDLEIEFYKQNDVDLVPTIDSFTKINMFRHYPYKQPWLTYDIDTKPKGSMSGLYLNRAYIITRYGFTGRAIYQLQTLFKYKPEVLRLINIKPAYWLVLELDWLGENGFRYELLTHHKVYDNLDQLKYDKAAIEQSMCNVDLHPLSVELVAKYDDWKDFVFSDANIYKKKYFGISDVQD